MPVPEFAITQAEHGAQVGTDGARRMLVLEPEARLFKRNAIKGAGTPGARAVQWLVAELDGVFVYLDGADVVVTRRALYP